MLKTLCTALTVLFLLVAAGVAQDYRFDAGVSATYSFSQESSGNGRVLSPTQAFGGVASVRMRLAPKHAVELEFGRTKNSQVYSVSGLDYRVQSTVSDFSGAYVFSPMRIGKAQPFVMGGVGVLAFNPSNTFVDGTLLGLGALKQTRVGFLYGGGFDYPVYWRLALRVQYRGLIYRAPDFSVSTLFTGANGHMAEPSVGVVFRF